MLRLSNPQPPLGGARIFLFLGDYTPEAEEVSHDLCAYQNTKAPFQFINILNQTEYTIVSEPKLLLSGCHKEPTKNYAGTFSIPRPFSGSEKDTFPSRPWGDAFSLDPLCYSDSMVGSALGFNSQLSIGQRSLDPRSILVTRTFLPFSSIRLHTTAVAVQPQSDWCPISVESSDGAHETPSLMRYAFVVFNQRRSNIHDIFSLSIFILMLCSIYYHFLFTLF